MVAADSGKYIRSKVTAANGWTPNGVAYSDTTDEILQSPVNDAIPTITSGLPAEVGQQLSGIPGDWTSNPAPPSFDYQWQVCDPTCVDIPGETSNTFTPTTSETGKTLRLKITATNGVTPDPVGSNVAYSAETDPVIEDP